jgi:hypothetical protein
MNAFKTIVWVEWKKTSSQVTALFSILAIGILLIGLRDVTHLGIMGQVAILMLLSMIGIGLVAHLSYKIGDDFRSDRFQTLRLSPVSPLIHLLARVGFLLTIASAYYLVLAGLYFLAIKAFLVGSESRMAIVLISYTGYFLVTQLLPGLVLILLASMIITSFGVRSAGKKLAVAVLLISSVFWSIDLLGLVTRVSGTYFSKIELPLPDGFIRGEADGPIFNSIDFLNTTGKTDSPSIATVDSTNPVIPFGGSVPIYFEPLILSLIFSALGLALTARIWTEVEL